MKDRVPSFPNLVPSERHAPKESSTSQSQPDHNRIITFLIAHFPSIYSTLLLGAFFHCLDSIEHSFASVDGITAEVMYSRLYTLLACFLRGSRPAPPQGRGCRVRIYPARPCPYSVRKRPTGVPSGGAGRPGGGGRPISTMLLYVNVVPVGRPLNCHCRLFIPKEDSL